MIKKRTAIIGQYNTAEHGWTLSEFSLSDPEQKLQYVEKVGGDGSWDMSTALTDGIPKYKNRELKITLKCSQGNREHRKQLISHMVNLLDGFEWPIIAPDHPDHYLTGRIHVAKKYNDLAHASVEITGTVAPWFFSRRDIVVEVLASALQQTVILRNSGRRPVAPKLTVAGDITITYGDISTKLPAGTYDWPALLLTPGDHTVLYNGQGSLRISYQEAVLE